MFDVLAPALGTWIAAVLDPQLPEGTRGFQLVAVRHSKKGISGKDYHSGDPQVQLRMLTGISPAT